jgi:hypothetical protein
MKMEMFATTEKKPGIKKYKKLKFGGDNASVGIFMCLGSRFNLSYILRHYLLDLA